MVYVRESWATASLNWIRCQKDENPELSMADLKKHCSTNYPYSMRKGSAYKSWLKAMREYFGGDNSVDGQDDMFCK